MRLQDARYDPDLQMFADSAREVDFAHLQFLRWLGERGRLEHRPLGASSGEYAAGPVSSPPQPADSMRCNRAADVTASVRNEHAGLPYSTNRGTLAAPNCSTLLWCALAVAAMLALTIGVIVLKLASSGP